MLLERRRKMMKRKFIQIRYLACIAAAFLMFGCAAGSKVTMKQESYTPGFRSADFGRYKGKTVILDNFINQATNTKTWGYNSADNKVYYEATTHLESYLWYCFQKAFQQMGMKVYDQTYGGYWHPYHPYWWGAAPPPRAPVAVKGATEFQLILTSMTDQEAKFQVLLLKNGENKLQKDYTVTVKPVSSQDTKELEKGAYKLIDQMIITVFKDREFLSAF
jgi:hypothetical protein